jgi:hypothetical protein
LAVYSMAGSLGSACRGSPAPASRAAARSPGLVANEAPRSHR